MKKMKRNVICMMILMGMSMESHAQQIDPALTGAVAAQSVMLNQLFSKREKTQQKIIAAEAAVTVAMDRMHKVEDQMLDYLSNAQGCSCRTSIRLSGLQSFGNYRDSPEHEFGETVFAWSSERYGNSSVCIG